MNVASNPTGSSFSDLSMDIATLEKNAEAFSYSSYVRYLLLVNYKKNGHSDFEKEAKKTALYFNNAQLLQFQLSQTENALQNEAHDSYSDTNHFAVLTEEQIESATNDKKKNEIDDEGFLTGTVSQPDEILHTSENATKSDGENIFENIPGQEEIISSKILQTEGGNAEDQASIINENSNIEEEENPLVDGEIIAVNTYGLHEEEASQNVGEPIENLNVTALAEQAISPQQEDKKEEEIIADTEALLIPGKVTLESLSTNEDVIAFEPLHTVDYFASQGIKITDEVFTNDKLGTQMKSFTEWLRSMKKLPNAKLPQQNSLAENIIQSAAESSNIDTEVLTEAMAEVLIKQNKREKAIEMYNKLSLINPAKSAYFAGKIESIKST